MGWFNRLCIRQLMKAHSIAGERLALARRHGSLAEVTLGVVRQADLRARIRVRMEIERHQEYRRRRELEDAE